MTTTIPLPIWPHDITQAQLDMILEAKECLDVDVRIIPSPAAPGGPGAVLAFGEIPPFFSESVLIRPENVDNPASIRGALGAVLAGVPATVSPEQWLSMAMGCDVTYVGEEACG